MQYSYSPQTNNTAATPQPTGWTAPPQYTHQSPPSSHQSFHSPKQIPIAGTISTGLSQGPFSSSQTGYTPIGFHGPSGVSSPAQFYDSYVLQMSKLLRVLISRSRLIDANCEPSEVFARMSDALFFVLDQRCGIPELRGTGFIEPSKHSWLMLMTGVAEDVVRHVALRRQCWSN